MQIETVKAGDTLYAIGRTFGVDYRLLAWTNQIEPPYRLAAGQALFIPDGGWNRGGGKGAAGAKGARPVAWMGGYAYPWIDPMVLEETADYLSGISVFSYGFTGEGDLVLPEAAGERRILAAAARRHVCPALVLAPLGADGKFNNRLVSALLQNLKAQRRLIGQLWNVAEALGYGEINLDFEYVLAEDQTAFIEFVVRLRAVMNVFGIRVTVALAPKVSADQRGLLYEGIDYRGLGKTADGVFLMTYEWGYTYGPPMAVAPLHMVRRVAEYAVSEIEPGKILLGIPNYGYDWPLPYERGVTKARSLGTQEAIRLAVDHGAEILYDKTAQSPYFYYQDGDTRHVVWFEDIRSVSAKFALLKELGLAGAGYWQLMRLFRAAWLLAENEFRIWKES